jgi:hypothetical protein
MEAVQTQMLPVGLVMAYYDRFGDDALQVSKEYFSQVGRMFGQNIKQSLNITTSDVNALAKVLDAFLMQAAGVTGAAKIEGNQVIMVNKGFCPVMASVKTLNGPWDKIDLYYGWPMIEGIASAVNPNVRMEVPETRHRGDKSCKHVFTIP